MATPASFTLQPVPAGSNPGPAPPRHTKSSIYRDIKVFQAVDEHAVKISKRNGYPSFRDMLWNLCFRKKFSPLERARVIFRWMTCPDLQNIYFSNGVPPGSPEQLLTSFKAGKTTYARIFECLARHAGLPCITLSGWAKGVDYRPGVAITSRPINHSWNAVLIDDDWQLIDCHWATRFLQSEENTPQNLVYEYDDFYFIPEPAELAYTHRPEDDSWQLVEPKVSAPTFEDYPLVKSYFFTTGMLFLPHNNHGVIKTKKGILALSLGYTGRLSFTYKLGHGDNMGEVINGHELQRCVIQETREDRVVFYTRLLDPGDFYIIVFAHLINDGPNQADENIFKAVCEYKIECTEGAPESAGLFPECSDASWGPDAFVSQFGLKPKHTSAILFARDGHAEVAFDKKGDVRMYARLVNDNLDPAALKKAVTIRNEGNKTTIVLDLPDAGEYGLEVFANSQKKDGDMFTHVCQYLCTYPPPGTVPPGGAPEDKDAISAAYGQVTAEAPLKSIRGGAGPHGAGAQNGAPGERGGAEHGALLLYKPFVDTGDEEYDYGVTDGVDAAADADEYNANYPLDILASLDLAEEPATSDVGHDALHDTPDKKKALKDKKKHHKLNFGPSLDPEIEYKPHDADFYHTEVVSEAPETFQIRAVNKEEMSPIPEAPSSTATKLFKDTAVFTNVDVHAMEVSKLEHASFRDILWHLIYARDITNELDKARAIFLWLCSKDLSKLNFTNVEKGSPEEVLMNLKQGQTTYARVYETLCSYAGLMCKTLTGYAKGAEYKPGMKFSGTQGQHSWNAVKVNGSYQLVDCHWAARRVVGKKLEITTDNVRYELDEYYFMPAPAQLIFTHFPEDASWQLLESRITLDEFQNLVPVKPAFFKYGLELDSHMDATIQSDGVAPVVIQIKCPQKMSKCLRFTFNITYEDGRDEFNGIKLNRFAMQELVGTVSYLSFRPPEQASYLMVVYAKDLTNQTKEGVYGGVCEYKIVCETSPSKSNPFPPCVHTTWGPGDSAPKFDMTPKQSGSIVKAVNGVAEVKFALGTKLRFVAKLKSTEQDDKALAPYVFYRTVGRDVVFRVAAPAPGEYGLEIYANNPEQGGAALQHAYQYLILVPAGGVPAGRPVEPFPTLSAGYLGPQASFEQFGLSVGSHADPYVENDSGDLHLTFKMTQALRITSQLLFVSSGENTDCSEYVLQQGHSERRSVTFVLKLPRTGLFKFQIFATLASETGDSLPGVYNYLINCKHTICTAASAFPKQFGPWKEGCYLYEPLGGHLEQSQAVDGRITFKMDVPNASAVAVVIGEEWVKLQKTEPATWHGDAQMDKHWEKEKKATVCGNFGATATSFSTLLEYSL